MLTHIKPADRTAGACAPAVRIEGNGEGRAPEFFLDAGGKQADDAGMPVFPCRDDDRRGVAGSVLRQNFRLGLSQHDGLHGLALAVELIQPLGDLLCLCRVLKRQQPAAKGRIADPATGIDARTDEKAEMIGCYRAAKPRLAEKRRESGVLHMARGNQSLDDIGPVQALQGNDIADRCQGDDIEQGEKIEAAGPLVAFRTQQAQCIDENQEDDAGGAEMPLPRQIVLPVRIDQRMAGRQRGAHLVMVDHHDVDAARSAATASDSWLVEPQSTVTISCAPSSISWLIAAGLGP